ncbi:MAG: putative bifunctional diguanylate cyclase/phosphodiesterase [Pseudomonadota bacterium]
MSKPLRVLVVEDSEDDTALILRELRRGGYVPDAERVDTMEAMRDVLARREWDVIITDFNLPRFSAIAALELLKASGQDLPFLIVSGTIGEDLAVAAMKAGAHDYLKKDNLARLVPAIERELREAEERRARRQAEEALREREEKYRLLFNNAYDAIFLNAVGEDGSLSNFLEVNDVACQRMGYGREELLGKQPCDVVDEESAQKMMGVMRELLRQGHTTFEMTLTSKGGMRIPVEISAHVFPLGESRVVLSIARDITERKRAEEIIWHQAYHDALTGLPNRVLFKDRLEQALAYAHRHQQMLSVIFLDLDRFKNINDTLGHSVGDQLLQAVAYRLTKCVREEDTVARMGGDEFTLILPEVTHVEDAAKIAQKLIDALKPPFYIDGYELYTSTSIGIAFYPTDGEEPETLLKNADTAMYRAKDQGRNNFQLYAAEMNSLSFERLALGNMLRKALDQEELLVHYQPQVDLDSGEIFGMEALVRWQHPELGLISPLQFISLAEETGLIGALGEWVLRTACAQNKAWQIAGMPPLRVAVNLSARQFKHTPLIDTVAHVLEDTGLAPQYLELELTESIVAENVEATITTLRDLKAMGVQLSIDDFGTGYSSLSYLKRFPLDMLKIDQSFVHHITTDADDAAIVTAVITLAHSLKLKVIAEGVQTEEQLAFLRAQRCDKVQGNLFSKPLTAEEFGKLLHKKKEERWDGLLTKGVSYG